MKKIIYRIILFLVLILIIMVFYFDSKFTPAKDNFEWGITFSPRQAEYLGFDWKTVYLDMLNDLKPQKLRLLSHWEMVEPAKDKYDFSIPDMQLIEAQKRGIDVIMVVGLKQPRWPECHQPVWYNDLTIDEKRQALIDYVGKSVEHFKQFDAIKIWQVENEALFSFGPECPQSDKDVLAQEIELVRSLDSRPVMLTDSGELGRWLPTTKLNPDILAPTMYRVVHNPKTGYFKYPLPSMFFRVKAGIVRTFSSVDNFIGSELQAEPWFADDFYHTPLSEQLSLMNQKIFLQNVEYAKKIGFKENYLWGVEWWYWLAKKQGDWGMWSAAKDLLSQ